jgi:transcriptional regulator with XRE-family HTH domain
MEAGLSLAKVGKGCVTAPAVYLIETGRTRPSLPTLEHIAQRLGRSVEFFLADQSGSADEARNALIELEAMVAEGRHQEAITQGEELLKLSSSAHRLGQLRFLLAQSYLALAQPSTAASLLRDAHAHFELVDDRLMLAECMGYEAHIAGMTQQPEALALAEQALALCRSIKPVPAPTETRILSILAAVHFGNRGWDKAIKLYEEAIAAAGSVFDLSRMAKMYTGLSLGIACRSPKQRTTWASSSWRRETATRLTSISTARSSWLRKPTSRSDAATC